MVRVAAEKMETRAVTFLHYVPVIWCEAVVVKDIHIRTASKDLGTTMKR